MVSPDETGWKVAGLLQWLWAFATRDTTIYRIQAGRGFDEAAAVLGSDFGGVLVRDGWAPYRQFGEAAHQTCLAHLLRRCRLASVMRTTSSQRQLNPHTVLASLMHARTPQVSAESD